MCNSARAGEKNDGTHVGGGGGFPQPNPIAIWKIVNYVLEGGAGAQGQHGQRFRLIKPGGRAVHGGGTGNRRGTTASQTLSKRRKPQSTPVINLDVAEKAGVGKGQGLRPKELSARKTEKARKATAGGFGPGWGVMAP